MATTDNLIFGSAKLYIAAAGTTFNASTDFDQNLWELMDPSWVDLGHTVTGVTLTSSPEFVKASSQQSIRTLDVGISEVTTTLTTTLREIDAQKLGDIVHGAGFPTGNDEVVYPGGKSKATKFAVLLWGPGPENKPLFLSASRAYYAGDRSVSFGNDEFSSSEVEIEILDSGFDQVPPFTITILGPPAV